MAGPPSQHPQDLHPLLLADRELPDLRLRMDTSRTDPRYVRARPTRGGLPAARRTVLIEVDVLATVIGARYETEVLVHHSDAGGDGLGGEVEFAASPFDLEVAGVEAVDAGEDVAQRLSSRRRLLEKRVHFAVVQLEVDVAVAPETPSKLFETWRARTAGTSSRP